MKLRACLTLVAVLLVGSGIQSAQGDNVTVDENGNGFVIRNGIKIPLHNFQGKDPGPGGFPAILTYDLSIPTNPTVYSSLVAGDVKIEDSPDEGGVSGEILDLVRFNAAPAGGNPTLVFYSDSIDGNDNPKSDLGIPSKFYDNVTTQVEVQSTVNGSHHAEVPEYTPLPERPDPNDPNKTLPAQPGFVPTPGDPTKALVTYRLISDAPESPSLLLFGAGALVPLTFAWRRRKKVA